MKSSILILAFVLTSSTIFARGGRGGGEKQEGIREAAETCHSELGITRPERGERPSEEDRAAMDECLSAKGFEKPEGGGGQRPERED